MSNQVFDIVQPCQGRGTASLSLDRIWIFLQGTGSICWPPFSISWCSGRVSRAWTMAGFTKSMQRLRKRFATEDRGQQQHRTVRGRSRDRRGEALGIRRILDRPGEHVPRRIDLSSGWQIDPGRPAAEVPGQQLGGEVLQLPHPRPLRSWCLMRGHHGRLGQRGRTHRPHRRRQHVVLRGVTHQQFFPERVAQPGDGVHTFSAPMLAYGCPAGSSPMAASGLATRPGE